MTFFYKNIIELKKYKKGEIIPGPDISINIGKLPYSVLNLLNTKQTSLVISRRSIGHIIQKSKVGLLLIKSVLKCLVSHDSIFLSDKNRNTYTTRLIIFKRNTFELKNMAVVIEYIENSKYISVVTAMVADEKYLIKKYKKLR